MYSKLVEVCKEKATNIFNWEELVDFEFPKKILTFPPSCPGFPACPHNREGVYEKHGEQMYKAEIWPACSTVSI